MSIEKNLIWSEQTGYETSIDVRENVRSILRDAGHYALLRKFRTTKSPTYDPYTKTGKSWDPFDNSLGHLYDDYMVLVRRTPTVNLLQGSGRELLTALGNIAPNRYVYFLSHPITDLITDAPIPTPSDQIIEVNIKNDGSPKYPLDIRALYDIEQATDFRDRNGRIEFWALVTREEELGK